MQYVFIGVGGAVGAVLRYVVSGWAYALLGPGFPWGTLVVNLTGSFLIGFLWELFEGVTVSPSARNMILAGGLGAFTTFSTFAFESLNLFRAGEFRLGMANILLNDLLGMALVFLGIIVGRAVAGMLRV